MSQLPSTQHSPDAQMAYGLTFDDVLLSPAASSVLPHEVDVSTRISADISLGLPLMSAAMDTVTESALAIAMAQSGGLGVIHRNMDATKQGAEIAKVKKFESVMVTDALTISPHATMREAIELMLKHSISGVPVIDPQSSRLCGILTNRDARFLPDHSVAVRECMTKRDALVTAPRNISLSQAKQLLRNHRIEKLLIVDDEDHCIGMITVKDIENAKLNPHASKDAFGRLRVAAAMGTGEEGLARAEVLVEAQVDVLVVDTAHGQHKSVLDTVRALRQAHPQMPVIAGNVATVQGAKDLIDAGAEGIKVGIGPGSICTTRMVAGVGVPQLTAILEVAKVCRGANVPCIADGGIKYSGDMVKALAAGADCVMIGSMLAGSDEAPGDMILYQGRTYKSYRGMGSVGAMARGSADRYFQQEVQSQHAAGKLVPEGVEGRVPYKGPVAGVIHQLIGGVRAGMGYTGSPDLASLRANANFVRISPAGLRESHVHDVKVTREAPNYGSV